MAPKKESSSKASSSSYAALGASHQKEEVHAALRNVDHGLFPSAFCKILADITQDPLYCSILHSDSVGTKSIIAYMMYKETGKIDHFRGLVHDSIVMNTDDLLCIGASETYLLSNVIERNKKLISGEILAVIFDEYERFTELLRRNGLSIFPCGGETGDAGDLIRTLSMDSTIYTRMKRSDVILPEHIQKNDVIVGLASFGKAKYEPNLLYNSGIGSNGLTLARHGVLKHDYYKKYPETVSPELEESFAFFGKYSLDDPLPKTNITIGQAILSPTRTYSPILIPLLKENRSEFHFICHNTGGGQTKCLKYGKGIHFIKDNLFSIPPFFELVQNSSNTDWKEMYQVFNMGHRMEIVCSESFAKEKLIPTSQSFDVEAQIIGHIEQLQKNESNQLTISSSKGEFKFSSN